VKAIPGGSKFMLILLRLFEMYRFLHSKSKYSQRY